MQCTANKRLVTILLGLFIIFPTHAWADKNIDELIPLGQSIGVQLKLEKPTFVHDVLIDEKLWFKSGDQIISLNDKSINSIADWKQTSNKTVKPEVPIQILRENKRQVVLVSTNQLKSMLPFIRDFTEGIGTITYVDPDTNQYGALGHQIVDQQIESNAAPSLGGSISLSDVARIHKSTPGKPGYKIAKQASVFVQAGNVKENTVYGVFGDLIDSNLKKGKAIPLLKAHNIKIGKAHLYTAIEGNNVKSYEINILKVEDTTFQFVVTDQALIDKTGGILQGMSGSPIIQDGKFAGAITHMVVDNPLKGAAIPIREMLKKHP
ncbi:SpoIVB peptidase S55 domain-containing protein [Paenisporosarcina sp. TG20]|uniref:SpoIVB peptidase S55 domain-containing protein n=1 Tax=Paenisporosarcina sp. TG20 TaxID=1211706 RepID=UPI0002D5F2CD|nr:SpoIVB peptidase S55 domain-containing protein [Paenisporosarcina sp. TG20]